MIRLWVWTYTDFNLLTTRNNDLVLECLGRNVADELVDVKFKLGPATERRLLLELAKRAGLALVESSDLSAEGREAHRRRGF